MDDDELAEIRNREIGFVFQTFNLLPRSNSLHNVELPLIYAGLPADERRERATQALENVGLGHRLAPPSQRAFRGPAAARRHCPRPGQQRPSIILADEPTGNLDSRTGEEIMALLEQLYAQGNTIIVVTHEPDIADHARRIVRLRDGLIESDGAITSK